MCLIKGFLKFLKFGHVVNRVVCILNEFLAKRFILLKSNYLKNIGICQRLLEIVGDLLKKLLKTIDTK